MIVNVHKMITAVIDFTSPCFFDIIIFSDVFMHKNLINHKKAFELVLACVRKTRAHT